MQQQGACRALEPPTHLSALRPLPLRPRLHRCSAFSLLSARGEGSIPRSWERRWSFSPSRAPTNPSPEGPVSADLRLLGNSSSLASSSSWNAFSCSWRCNFWAQCCAASVLSLLSPAARAAWASCSQRWLPLLRLRRRLGASSPSKSCVAVVGSLDRLLLLSEGDLSSVSVPSDGVPPTSRSSWLSMAAAPSSTSLTSCTTTTSSSSSSSSSSSVWDGVGRETNDDRDEENDATVEAWLTRLRRI
mmetsp:Transcript_27707/g.81006  ORF Transcript_27707/g.81006 Transcript_27707/m.81006 type:complete len:245 (-) Transcript_27707:395-1129(-)